MNDKTRKQQSESDDLWGSSSDGAAGGLGLGAAATVGTGMVSGAMGALGATTAKNAAKRPAKKPFSFFSKKKTAKTAAPPPMTLTPIAAPAASSSSSSSKTKSKAKSMLRSVLSRSSSRSADDAASEAEGMLGDFAGSDSETTAPEGAPSGYRISPDMGALLNDGPADFSESEEEVADLTELDGTSSSEEGAEEEVEEEAEEEAEGAPPSPSMYVTEAVPPLNPPATSPAVVPAASSSMYITPPVPPLQEEKAATPSMYMTAPVSPLVEEKPVSSSMYMTKPEPSLVEEKPVSSSMYMTKPEPALVEEKPVSSSMYMTKPEPSLVEEKPVSSSMYMTKPEPSLVEEKPVSSSMYMTKPDSALRVDTAADSSNYKPAPPLTSSRPSQPSAQTVPDTGNDKHDDTTISDDDTTISEDVPMGSSQAQSDFAHQQRKVRAEYGTLDKPKENSEGYTPRKIDDAGHWDENKEYFQPLLAQAARDAGVTARTKYYNDEEREAHRVNVKDGLLTDAGGSLLDTSKAEAPMADGAQGGRHIFAMTQENEMYSADAVGENNASTAAVRAGNGGGGPKQEYLDRTHHTSFVEGKAVNEFGNYNYEESKGVKGAGELQVNEGWLSRISNVSGHYVPDIKNTHATLKALDAQGLNMDATTVENLTRGSGGKKTDTYQARAMLASNMDLGLLDAQKDAFAQIKGGVNLKATAPAAARENGDWWKDAYNAGEKSAAPKVARPNADKQSLADYKEWKDNPFADTAGEGD